MILKFTNCACMCTPLSFELREALLQSQTLHKHHPEQTTTQWRRKSDFWTKGDFRSQRWKESLWEHVLSGSINRKTQTSTCQVSHIRNTVPLSVVNPEMWEVSVPGILHNVSREQLRVGVFLWKEHAGNEHRVIRNKAASLLFCSLTVDVKLSFQGKLPKTVFTSTCDFRKSEFNIFCLPACTKWPQRDIKHLQKKNVFRDIK